MARAPRFTPGLSQAELQAGYSRVGRRAPISKTDIKKAYKPYGLKLDKARGKASDAMLYKAAASAVIKRYKKNKAKKS